MVEAIIAEIALQKDYLTDTVETIYLGGGTPSLLTQHQLNRILEKVNATFNVSENAEITLEANPDDLKSIREIEEISNTGVNRLSIGIQSFQDAHLKYLNRAHTAHEARHTVQLAKSGGIENITIDLIYGIPSENHAIWEKDLELALALNVPHISAYCLTIEEKTVFGNWLKQGKIKAVEDEFAAQQFEILLATLTAQGFEQYEISNFAKEGNYSKHNTNYWRQVPYLGVGPGAHSFNGSSRQFNVKSNAKYMKEISMGTIPFELEPLEYPDFINEYLMTSLRTSEGCDLTYLQRKYQYNLEKEQLTAIEGMFRKKLIYKTENRLKLTTKGKLLADQIAADLFIV